MGKIVKFEDLECWQDSRILCNMIYKLVSIDNIKRDFGLKDQFCKAAISIMNNIAEGYSRFSNKEFIYFLSIANGSCSEVKSMLYIVEDQEFISSSDAKITFEQIDKTQAKILGLVKYLRKYSTQKNSNVKTC